MGVKLVGLQVSTDYIINLKNKSILNNFNCDVVWTEEEVRVPQLYWASFKSGFF